MIFNPTGSGKKLPSLNNPGTADDLAKGKELIGADGQIVTGTLETPTAYSTGTLKNGEQIPAFGGGGSYGEYANDGSACGVIVYKRAGEPVKSFVIDKLNNLGYPATIRSPDNTIEIFHPNGALYVMTNKGADMQFVTFVMGDSI
nr:MAG TPA: hypothetical protein [Caudoviricetes sp.]